ncbi:hypothetical protein K2P47_02745 [Patescibacteria group bacterium]|nr:hypothetical protein [Patescibacteria group bacterium]
MKKIVLAVIIVGLGVGGVVYLVTHKSVPVQQITPVVVDSGNEEVAPNETAVASNAPTERYSAQVDRVKVIFEQWDYTRYRLQTNELVREGEMNSERGFGDDPDATVYVLNWQAPEGEQIRYVRLTTEPGYLYAVDGNQNSVKSGRLVLEDSLD